MLMATVTEKDGRVYVKEGGTTRIYTKREYQHVQDVQAATGRPPKYLRTASPALLPKQQPLPSEYATAEELKQLGVPEPKPGEPYIEQRHPDTGKIIKIPSRLWTAGMQASYEESGGRQVVLGTRASGYETYHPLPKGPTEWERVVVPHEKKTAIGLFEDVDSKDVGRVERRTLPSGERQYRVISKEQVETEEVGAAVAREMYRETPLERARSKALVVLGTPYGIDYTIGSLTGASKEALEDIEKKARTEAAITARKGAKEKGFFIARSVTGTIPGRIGMVWGVSKLFGGLYSRTVTASGMPSLQVLGGATTFGGLVYSPIVAWERGTSIGEAIKEKDYRKLTKIGVESAIDIGAGYGGFKSGVEGYMKRLHATQAERGVVYPGERQSHVISKVETEIGGRRIKSAATTTITKEGDLDVVVSRIKGEGRISKFEAFGKDFPMRFELFDTTTGRAIGTQSTGAGVGRVIVEQPGFFGSFKRTLGSRLGFKTWGYDIQYSPSRQVSRVIGSKDIFSKGEFGDVPSGEYGGWFKIVESPDEFANIGGDIIVKQASQASSALARSKALSELGIGKVKYIGTVGSIAAERTFIGGREPDISRMEGVESAKTSAVKYPAKSSPSIGEVLESPKAPAKGSKAPSKKGDFERIISAPLEAEFSKVGKLKPPAPKKKEPLAIEPKKPEPRVVRLEARERIEYGNISKAAMQELARRKGALEQAGYGLRQKRRRKQEQAGLERVIGLQEPGTRVGMQLSDVIGQQLGRKTIYPQVPKTTGRTIPIQPAPGEVIKDITWGGLPRFFKLSTAEGRRKRVEPRKKYYEEKLHPGDIYELVGLGRRAKGRKKTTRKKSRKKRKKDDWSMIV